MTAAIRSFLRAVISPLFFYFQSAVFCLGLLGAIGAFFDILAASQVCVRNQCFEVEVASTPAQRELGLMNRVHMSRRAGMWFVFDRPDQYAFWMKDTRLSLDIIWVSASGRIVDMVHRATPGSLVPMVPSKPAQYVLEINGGLASALKFRVGDPVVFKK
jgi:uncharacterized membrane protein (UPF0127 family)